MKKIWQNVKQYLKHLALNWFYALCNIVHAIFHVVWGFIPPKLIASQKTLRAIDKWHRDTLHGQKYR
jgi:hypothetical protein